MDVALRYQIAVLKPGTEPTPKQMEKPTVHKYSRTTGITACGKKVPEGDKRWKASRDGKEEDVTCARCLSKMGKASAQPKAKTPSKPKAKKVAEPLLDRNAAWAAGEAQPTLPEMGQGDAAALAAEAVKAQGES